MNKKVLSVILTLFMLVAVLPTAVFAKKTASTEIDEAIKAVRSKANEVVVYNDMTPDEFLAMVARVLPEDNTCKLSFEKETDYRISNASSQKSGSIFANILFTSSYETTHSITRHEMYDFKIAQLTGDAAEENADVEKLAEDRQSIASAFQKSFDYTVTQENLLEVARSAVKNGTVIESAGDFTLKAPTVKNRGNVKLTLNLTLNGAKSTYKVNNVVRQLEAAPAEDNTQKEDTANTEIKEPASDTPSAVNFADVSDSDYFAAAVEWAVDKKITAGTSSTTFSPNDTCTRAQILTFLWRAVGSPKMTAENPFGDVKSTDYYYDAAVWANEKGMVTGTNFEADTPCTRSATVMYLWQNAGAPEVNAEQTFSDVDVSSDYAEAVAWAVGSNVTSGTSATTFSPDMTCTRGQIVTFLFRAIK